MTMVGLVCVPIIGMNIYSIFFLDVTQALLFHLIECLILTFILTIMLLAEIFTGNRINRYDSFLLKSSYDKTCDQLDRFKGGISLETGRMSFNDINLSLTALKSKIYYPIDVVLALTKMIGKGRDQDLGKALVHYRYSELPSPTNEINLVTFEKLGMKL